MCSDGNRLCGASKLRNALKKKPSDPSTGARSNPGRSGNITKNAAATRIENAIRRANVQSSFLSRQRKGAATKNRSIDRYGTIVSGTSGIHSSHAKYQVGTSELGRCAANQFVLP